MAKRELITQEELTKLVTAHSLDAVIRSLLARVTACEKQSSRNATGVKELQSEQSSQLQPLINDVKVLKEQMSKVVDESTEAKTSISMLKLKQAELNQLAQGKLARIEAEVAKLRSELEIVIQEAGESERRMLDELDVVKVVVENSVEQAQKIANDAKGHSESKLGALQERFASVVKESLVRKRADPETSAATKGLGARVLSLETKMEALLDETRGLQTELSDSKLVLREEIKDVQGQVTTERARIHAAYRKVEELRNEIRGELRTAIDETRRLETRAVTLAGRTDEIGSSSDEAHQEIRRLEKELFGFKVNIGDLVRALEKKVVATRELQQEIITMHNDAQDAVREWRKEKEEEQSDIGVQLRQMIRHIDGCAMRKDVASDLANTQARLEWLEDRIVDVTGIAARKTPDVLPIPEGGLPTERANRPPQLPSRSVTAASPDTWSDSPSPLRLLQEKTPRRRQPNGSPKSTPKSSPSTTVKLPDLVPAVVN